MAVDRVQHDIVGIDIVRLDPLCTEDCRVGVLAILCYLREEGGDAI